MEPVWRFFTRKQNRIVLSWLGGGAVIVIGGLWTVLVFLNDKKPPDPCIGAGAVTAGRDINGSTITTNGSGSTDCSRTTGKG